MNEEYSFSYVFVPRYLPRYKNVGSVSELSNFGWRCKVGLVGYCGLAAFFFSLPH